MGKWIHMGLLLVAPVMVGCGGDGLNRVPVQGVLTAEGEPVEGASVQFLPVSGTDSPGGLGNTDSEGKFTLVSSREGDTGIPPGKYTVRVSRQIDGDGTILPADAIQADYPMAMESVPAPYSGMDSPLEVTVSENGGEVKVEIPKKIAGKRKS